MPHNLTVVFCVLHKFFIVVYSIVRLVLGG